MNFPTHPNQSFHNFLAYKIGNKFLKKSFPLLKGKLLDVGCGSMYYKNIIENNTKIESYTGIDWADSSYKLPKGVVFSDLSKKIPFKKENFDSIICLSVLEHLKKPHVCINEMNRVLKKNGTLIIQVPFQWWIHEAPNDFFRFTPYSLKYMLIKSGFKDTNINIESQGGLFVSLGLKLSYFFKRYYSNKSILRRLFNPLIILLSYISQKLLYNLDFLDRDKDLESFGYWVIIKK